MIRIPIMMTVLLALVLISCMEAPQKPSDGLIKDNAPMAPPKPTVTTPEASKPEIKHSYDPVKLQELCRMVAATTNDDGDFSAITTKVVGSDEVEASYKRSFDGRSFSIRCRIDKLDIQWKMHQSDKWDDFSVIDAGNVKVVIPMINNEAAGTGTLSKKGFRRT